MQKLILTAILAMLVSTSSFAKWDTSSTIDEMEGTASHHARSEMSNARMYNRAAKTWMGVGCNNAGKFWVYFGFTSQPNITGDKTKSGYSESFNKVKFDDSATGNWNMTQAHGSKFLHVMSDAKFIQKLNTSSKVKIQLSLYSQGKTVFNYDLSGSTAAIKSIMSKCGIAGS